jgi:hypothetical protein
MSEQRLTESSKLFRRPADFSLILDGPLFQLLCRAHLCELAQKLRKPVFHLAREKGHGALELRRFLQLNHIQVRNVAGSRGSKEPEVYDYASTVLRHVLAT